MLLRESIGDALRRHRTDQDRTLREVSATAAVSLGYLSEVERGKKEPSSELLASICDALRVPIAQLLREVSDELVIAAEQRVGSSSATSTPTAPVVPISIARSGDGAAVCRAA